MPEKEKATLIKIVPIRRKITTDTSYDSLLIWYRDANGVKRTKYIDRAKVPYYVLKDKESPEAFAPPMFIEKDKVEKHEVYSDMLYREIASKTGAMAFYDRVITSYPERKQVSNLKNLLKHNYIYDADMDISDRYIKYFNEEFDLDQDYKLRKCSFDIEVDLMPNGFDDKGYIGFPDEDEAPCPINIITLIDNSTHDIYILAVNNPKNAQQQEFNANLDAEKERIIATLKDEYSYIPNKFDVRIYQSERECIESFFKLVHEIDPDFISGWNSKFDIKTMMNRLIKLYGKDKNIRAAGINPKDQMAHTVCDERVLLQKDSQGADVYLSPFAYYTTHPDQTIVDRMETFSVLDGVNWFDAMLLYANVRKTSGLKESYSLDAIANEELGQEKLDYTGYTIKNLAWKNYRRFFLYNLVDVLILNLLENKNLDFDMVQRLSEITNTRKEKVFKKTISLKNFVCKFAEQQGYIMGNNKNAHYGDEGEYFETNYLDKKEVRDPDPKYTAAFTKKENYGAYVGDPNLNDYCGITDSSGNKSKFIFEHVFDEDFSSLYPSVIRAYSLSPNTQIGKFFLLDSHTKNRLLSEYGYDGLFMTSKNEEASSDGGTSVDDIGPTLVDSLESQNWTRIGEKFFDLPSVTDVINHFKKSN